MNISTFFANLTIDVLLIAILAFGSVLLMICEAPAFFRMCIMNIPQKREDTANYIRNSMGI